MLLQLVNLYMSAPRFDSVALESTIRSLQSYVDDPNGDPDLAEYIAYSDARFGSEPRFRVIPTTEELAGLDLDAIERVWRDRFANASDWVFVLTGDFDMDERHRSGPSLLRHPRVAPAPPRVTRTSSVIHPRRSSRRRCVRVPATRDR